MIYVQDFLQCSKDLEIDSVLLQSKANFLTLYADNTRFNLFFMKTLKRKNPDHKIHITVFVPP